MTSKINRIRNNEVGHLFFKGFFDHRLRIGERYQKHGVEGIITQCVADIDLVEMFDGGRKINLLELKSLGSSNSSTSIRVGRGEGRNII